MVLPILAALGGGLIQALGARSAARAQERSTDRQMAFNERVYNDQRAAFQPYSTAGTNALGAYNYNLGIGDRPEGYTDFTGTPGYDFRMTQGQRAIDSSAAARGGLFSGRTGMALQDYGQGMASQEYGGYMDRLAGIANMGQASAAGQATAAGNLGTMQTNALAQRGNAQAAGAVGVGNAINDAIGNGLGVHMYQQQINQQPNALSGGGGQWWNSWNQ